MSAIDKMYEKYGVKLVCTADDCPILIVDQKECGCCFCEHFKYPSFTTEKQLELVKLIGKTLTSTECSDRLWDIFWRNDFEEALASRVNSLYQDLTSTQRQKVKEILER